MWTSKKFLHSLNLKDGLGMELTIAKGSRCQRER